MNDENFHKLMNRTRAALEKHNTLLKRLEAEYERRFKHSPSNNDGWVDLFHVGGEGMQKYFDYEEVVQNAKEVGEMQNNEY